jgi:thiamine biosynthesis lipoprotein
MKTYENSIYRKMLILVMIAGFSCFSITGCSEKNKSFIRTAEKIGTFVQLTVISDDEKQAEAAFKSVFEEFDQVNNLMSAHRDDSELSKVNRASGIKPVRVSPSLVDILEKSADYSRKTGGMFDVTIGPVLRLWGFYRNKGYLPSDKELHEAVSRVGWQNLSIDRKSSTVFLTGRGMALDLGAIAKGYAVDRAVERLKKIGIKNAMINAGGNLFAIGNKDGTGWNIGIRHPEKDDIFTTLHITNKAIATSGCYERFFDLAGKRYCHIIDAHTGLPINNGILSVTIIAPTATDADAMSTSVMLLGPEDGFLLLKKTAGFDGLILFRDAGSSSGISVKKTKGFTGQFH